MSTDSLCDYGQLLALADARFAELPLLVEGESKVLRAAAPGLAVVRLKPTLFSFRAGRHGIVEGTDALRLRISERLWAVLEGSGIPTTIRSVGLHSYLTEFVDAPPIEVVVKACNVGTPKHIYSGMGTHRTRFGTTIEADVPHPPYVRFDWRNPLPDRDECLPLWLADQFIDVNCAQKTALYAFDVLSSYFQARGLHLLDICFMMTSDGKALYGEVSPDCMRLKRLGLDMDKDLWRKGKDAEVIVRLWSQLLSLLSD
jgi:phosphoribosylaminoimidazole-succinocarboxamide synthase